jgi:hypothetical protein
VPHQVLYLLEQKSRCWLTAGRLGRYQVILLDDLNATLQTTSASNPATLLPAGPKLLPPHHKYMEVLDAVFAVADGPIT